MPTVVRVVTIVAGIKYCLYPGEKGRAVVRNPSSKDHHTAPENNVYYSYSSDAAPMRSLFYFCLVSPQLESIERAKSQGLLPTERRNDAPRRVLPERSSARLRVRAKTD